VISLRLTNALSRAEIAGDVGAWLAVAEAIYGERSTTLANTEPIEFRNEIRRRAAILRGGFRSRSGRIWAAQQLGDLLGRLLSDSLEPGPLSPALFTQIEELKARTLLDAMHDRVTARTAGDVSASAAKAERDLMNFAPPDAAQKGAVAEEMRLASLLPLGTPWDRAQRSRALAVVEAEYAKLGIEATPPAAVATLDDIRSALEADEALIEYSIPVQPLHPAPQIWACFVSRSRAEVMLLQRSDGPAAAQGFIGRVAIDGRAPIDASPVGRAVVEARTAIRDGNDAEAAPRLAALGSVLLKPLVDSGWLSGIRRLVVVPQGVLHYVPFAALPVLDGGPLVRKIAVTLAPSATAWLRTLEVDRPGVAAMLGLANPTIPYRPDLPPLREAETEIEKIAQRLVGVPATLRTGADASEKVLQDHARGAGIVHLATHGDFPEDNAIDMHRVLLAPDAGHDGPLHAEEIRALDLRATRVLGLSVCNGGLYRFGPGDEPYGLIPAGLVAGAENVIATLWPLGDTIGRLFMTRVYRDLLRDGPAEALRATSAQFLDNREAIRDWAAFVVVGNGRPFH
jgi:CHAT domain-containing protein